MAVSLNRSVVEREPRLIVDCQIVNVVLVLDFTRVWVACLLCLLVRCRFGFGLVIAFGNWICIGI
jgi:hypothetical protein